jgi:hypothetical protein
MGIANVFIFIVDFAVVCALRHATRSSRWLFRG